MRSTEEDLCLREVLHRPMILGMLAALLPGVVRLVSRMKEMMWRDGLWLEWEAVMREMEEMLEAKPAVSRKTEELLKTKAMPSQ